ncbi:lysosomal-trafficking regulator isoform X7 [Dunckerocampus dactyliophorus]|uniref:lysosomal-trafficking regulator isoform X7 n=1 Tax=Dunckerocampus dactyliophorus TaxID=161453 RepID=UPI0024058A4D|nr:lysosomal-trafficking regulator isoform X7 [Dunckerocampus dactyliophorus]
MASPLQSDLCYAWEKYMDCRLQGADLQVTLQSLESFLCLFHYVQHHPLHTKDALKFCSDMSGASNTLAREFLTDVHQLCSAVAQRAEAREEDEEESHMVALGEYLVRGRGFLLLSTLDSIIDQELTCREELLTLLLSLLPLVWKIPVQEEKAPDFTLPSLLEVFLSREVKAVPLRAGQKTGIDEQESGKRPRVGSGTWKSRRSRRTSQKYSVKDARRSQVSTSDSEANTEDKAGPGGSRSRRSHGSTIRVSCQHHRLEATQLTATATTNTETMSAPYPHPRVHGSQTMDTETLTDPAAMSIFNRMENSPFDLCYVLLSLLEKVCKFDMSINHNPGLAVSVVPTLTEILTEFGDCCGPGGGGGTGAEELAGGWTEEPIALVQRMLLRTILHLMSVDVGQSETLPDSLRRSLTDLLRATLKIRSCLDRQTNPFAPRLKKTLQEVQDDFSFSRFRHRALLLPELLEGVLQVLLGCLQASTPNPFFFSQALDLIHEFVQHRGLELFEATVLRLEELGRARDSEVGGEAAERLRGLIAGVFKIISAVKKAKSEQLHQSVCARRRHRRCEYSHFLHHHRDLSGLPVSAFKKAARGNPFEEDGEGKEGMEGDAVRYPERCCCLAACSHQCLRLLQRLSPNGPAVLQVLAGVQAVGICCCMDPRSVIRPLLDAFQAPGLRSYQSHVLSVLGRLILEQLGGGQPSERAKLASCNICTLDQSQLPGLEETLQHAETSALPTSLCYRSQGILPSGGGAEDMLWKWDALEAYQELVFGEDRQLSQQVAGHVCHLTLRGNAVVQWQLYTHIFNPVLQRGVELAHHAQQLGVSTVCTQVCSYHTQCLPVEVLLIYLQALPALLKSRVIRDLFISCNGLNQMTELVYLDQTCSLALKVFETLITTFGHQQAENVLQELEIAVAEQKQTVSNLAEDLGSRGSGEGPQSLSKFYEGLKEAYPHHKSRSGQGRGARRSQAETHLHVINLFLCVAFLCVSKEADSDRDSANDSEDTSGYDSTASEPLGGRLAYLSPDSVTLPSKEQVRRAADVWSVCRCVYLANPLFQRQFFRLGGLDVCLRLMSMVIQKLSCKNKDGKAKKKKEFKAKSSPGSTVPFSLLGVDEPSHDSVNCTAPAEGKTRDPTKRQEEEWQLQSIRLLEALLAICLHSANLALQRTDSELSYQLQSVEDTLLEVRDQLSRSGVVSSDLAVPLFDSLLRVALANISFSPDPPEEKPDRKLQVLAEGAAPAGDLSEEVDGVQSCGIKPPGEEEEEGYDADSESNPEDMVNQEEGFKVESVQGEFATVADGPGRGVLLFPEICTVELQLLATGSPDLEVLSHVFHSLLGAVRANHRNAALLYDQGGVKTILSGFHNILSQADSSLIDCQTVIVELLVAMVRQRITAEELALLIRLFLDKTPPTEILLKGILQIVEANVNIEPLYQLDFPITLGALTPGGVSPSCRANGTAGGKSVGLLWKGKLSPGRREGDSELRPSHLCSSPWNTAPLHLPLVGQNCWPHMASGFSASMWLRVVEQEEKEGNTEKEKRNMPAVDSHHGSPQAGRRVVEESLIHILSMGSKALMLQVWADFSTGSLTFRVCIDPNDEIKAGLLAQAESGEGLFQPGQWQHLGLTYTQQPEGKKNIHGRVVVWVCGIMKCEVFLDYTLPRKSSLSSDSNKTFCMLGHCIASSEEVSKQQRVHWSMGTVLLFNGARVGSDEAFFLYTSGPDLTSIMPCNYGKATESFSKFVTQEGLKCERVREILMKSKDVDTTALVESLAVVYAPSSPRVYTIYEPVIRLKGQAKTVVTQRPFSSKEVQSVSLEPNALKALLPTETHGLQSVLHKIGGSGNFVFLFAQTVELSDCEMTQALALHILLSLSKFNQHRIHEMNCYHGYSMIHQVLIKSKCVVGYHMLKTLLVGCCSGPILILGEDGQFRLDTESIAVVQDIRLLSDVLLDWKIWAKAECGVWETLLAALEILIRVHHPYQVFNIRQFLKAEVVHRFLLTCQVLQEHRDEHLTAIPQEVCLSFIKIIQEVLGSPPDLDLLKLIYNFLLAVHPPTNTYVCHTPSSFYFSLHIGHLHVPSPEHGGEDQSLRPPSLAPSPYTSPSLTPRLTRSGSNEAGDVERVSLSTQQALGSTETLKKGGGGDEQLLSSCESAKTICDSREMGKEGGQRTPSISVEEERDEAAEVDSLAEGSVGVAESEDRFDWTSDEAPRRPDSLKGIQSFQRSHSNLDSLGLAFPATNGSLAISRWPSAADRSSVPEDWESYTYSPGYERAHSKTDSNDRSSTEDCLVLICCGLYDLLRGVLLLLPDLMLDEVMDKLIQPEALVVLVNHSSPLIQQGVMKLLDAYFSRANKEQKEKFLKNHGFSLLANQLYIHQGSQGLIECFLEMLFGRPVGMEEDLDLEEMETISPFTKRCIIPVLGLIENSLCENSLVHNILCMLLQLLNACPKLADILLDHGLLYVLFNTLSTLNGMETGIPLNDYKLLVCDIQQLLVAVTIHSCSSSGSQYFRIIEDLITLLGFMQTSKMRRTQEMAVALQFRVLQSAIEFIKTTANQGPQKLSSSHNAPSSPHHAIYQKRKSIAGRRRFSLAQTDSLLMRMRSVASDELNQMMQRRMSQENPIRASETEFVQRLQRLVVLAVNRLIYHDVSQDLFDLLNIPDSPDQQLFTPESGDQTHEEGGSASAPHSPIPFTLPPASKKSLQKDILKLMMDGIKISLGSPGRGGAPHQQWRRILWSCRDTFRVQIGRLLVHTLSPTRPVFDRKEALEFVFDPRHLDILKESLSPGLEHGPKLSLYLYEMLQDHRDCLTKDEQNAVGIFMTSLKLCGHRCIPPNVPHKQDLLKAIKEEKIKYEAEEKTSKVAWEKKMTNTQRNLIQRLDGKSKDISKIAADITQNVSLRQGMERKKVIQHIRGLYKTDLSASRHWQELVQQLTHDRAVWYDQTSYPTSWQLDPTEGPNRERRRLQRCYLTIPNKYLLKDRRKPEDTVKSPLSFLFEDKTHSSFSSTVKDKATSEPIRFTRRCISVAPSRETAGELLLGKSGMYFVEDNAADAHDSQSLHGETEAPSFSWTYEEIKEVHKRWWQLRDNAVEIFLTNGRTLLLAFDNNKFRDDVYHNILTSDLPNLLEHGNITPLTQLWGSGQISNFEYLTHLNKHAGRSFNDLMQYPVFPFILRDYTSETLDLQDATIYRNLSKPIAVQSKEKEDRYVDNYRYLEEEYRKGIREDDPMPPVQPYHYGSHYSNSGTVLHFLVRMPPFTKMFLAYQDQSFDIPDRTFHSMNTTWRLSSYESMTDVKELIPEFFYLPEFLVNREGFDFGVRQNSERVNHVNLPPWARNDPRLFILIHRQALESDQVSQTLCQWIDLVFGLKQKGKAAVQAINVFHPATYFGMDVSAVEDPVQRRALETMIKTYGQTPRQLFNTSHVSRAGPKLMMEGELPAAMGLLVQLAFRETREQAKEIICPSPLPWIKGLKWGEYVGSPSAPDPVVCFSQPHGERFGSLLALPTRAICGLSRKFCLMMIYSKEQGVRSMHSTDIQWSAILSWGYADNILRLKSKQSEPPINFIQCSPLHQVTSCAWVPDGCQLFTGSKCGVITAYSNRFTSTTPSEMEVESQVHLYGHTGEVTSLFVCKPYSILISVSTDGTCILWDLNRLCYVQSLTGHKSPVTAVSASETTGDIATVCDSVGGGSDLRLWTVNGDLVGHVHCREIICSVAFSNQPEGVSVNVIAGGLENGVVRLWSTWDLKPVREITFPKSCKPIISLTYSCDGHHLYTANSEGTVMAWCRRDQQRMKLPMFYSFLSSYAAG